MKMLSNLCVHQQIVNFLNISIIVYIAVDYRVFEGADYKNAINFSLTPKGFEF